MMRKRKTVKDKIETALLFLVVTGVYAYLFIRLFTDPLECKASAPIEDTFISPEIVELIEEIAPEYNFSVELIEAIIETESSGDPYALSIGGDCYGLMQYKYSAHKDINKRLDIDSPEMLYDPELNITAGCDYLYALRREYGEVFTALAHYNGRDKAYPNPYVRKIINRSYDLEEVHGLHNYEDWE